MSSKSADRLVAVLVVQKSNHFSVATYVGSSISFAEATDAMLVTVRLDKENICLRAIRRRDMFKESRSEAIHSVILQLNQQESNIRRSVPGEPEISRP